MTTTIDPKQGGNYEILRNRLSTQGSELAQLTRDFNERRLDVFGKSKNEIIGKVNVHTDNRCTPVDIAEVNDLILIGYDVTLGLKQVPNVGDMLMLYRLVEEDESFRIETVSSEGTFLESERFQQSFTELFTYYKGARLVKVKRDLEWIYIAFQIGQLLTDLKVFRFEIRADNSINYVDDQGHNDIFNSVQSDIEWIPTTRDDHVEGRHPHINILDRLFVETVGGDLTVKIEDNTETGLGIYSETVEDKHQVLSDADISYAQVSEFILLKIKPHRENKFRYILFNSLTEQVMRLDALGASCKLLPEDHGLIFPNGYALASGEVRLFEEHSELMRYSHTIHSPNGEDVLYVFFDITDGSYLLYSYSLIEKDVATPIYNHGFCRFSNGQLVMFRHSDSEEATRVHPLRVWQTPYLSAEAYEAVTRADIPQFYRNNGNADLVRGISDLNTIVQYTQSKEVTQSLFEAMINYSTRTLDQYYWLADSEVSGIVKKIQAIMETASNIIDEFAKVQAMQASSVERLKEYEAKQKELITKIKVAVEDDAAHLISVLSELKRMMGILMSLRNERYMDQAQLDQLGEELNAEQESLNERLVELLQDESAYAPYGERIDKIVEQIEEADRSADLAELEEEAGKIRDDLMLVNEEVSSIDTGDPTETTRIIDLTTNVISRLNAVLATLKNQQQAIRSVEADAEFASQFKLLTQTMETSLSQIQTPEDVDQQQARILGMVEKLESRFAEFDQFLAEIYAKRSEIITVFENYKKDQLSQFQRRIDNISSAADVSLKSIQNRVQRFDSIDELNSYFISDPLVLKVRELANNIRELNDNVRADGLESKLKSLQDQSLRALRDNQDIFEEGGAVIKLGNHKFSVNQQGIDLTLSKHQGKTAFHLTGTEFYQHVDDEDFLELEEYSALEISSESDDLYRSEYLAYSIIDSAQKQETPDDVTGQLSIERLIKSFKDNELADLVTKYSAPLYREGYVKGVHDHDTVKILSQILPIYEEAGLLRISQKARMYSLLHLIEIDQRTREIYADDARDALLLYREFGEENQIAIQEALWRDRISEWQAIDTLLVHQMAEYIVQLLGDGDRVIVSRDAQELASDYRTYRDTLGLKPDNLSILEKYQRHHSWLKAYCKKDESLTPFIDEAAGLAILEGSDQFKFETSQFSLRYEVNGLLGQHRLIKEGALSGTLDDFLLRGLHHKTVVNPNYVNYLERRNDLVESFKSGLNLEDFIPRPLTSFVRNKLITDSYLQLFGNNFAKQMGALGEDRRTDLMGLLLLISPPGYGKTTLVEYIAGQMGLVFVKINCPSLGHEVTSLDPADAPNATAAREIEKLNFGLEMGSNVLLYLDDIQHTHPEFLQKFISLSDGTRRVEGVWQGQPKTYDMRGKKFALVMAGNPYTESGEAFKVPDMLANRADIYNLGDMLSDQQEAFRLSYIENSLTSNRTLAPMATRNLNDLYLLVDEARGKAINHNDLEHPYSTLEINEIVDVLQRLLKVQEVLLMVNQQYITSAATADHYRTEPPFLLQGSYRDMNRLAERIVSAMSDEELEILIDDHYQGEAQTLTTGAEDNLLKLKEMRGTLTEEERKRWDEIKSRFARNVELGSEDDPQVQMAAQLYNMSSGLQSINEVMVKGLDSRYNSDSESEKRFQAIDEEQTKVLMAISKAILDSRADNKSIANALIESRNDTKAITDGFEQYLSRFTSEMEVVNKNMAANVDIQKLQAKISELNQKQLQGRDIDFQRGFKELADGLHNLVDALLLRTYKPNNSFTIRRPESGNDTDNQNDKE